jgi:hypothetical protein
VRGSISQYFAKARKVNIHTPNSLNAVVEALAPETPIVLADMGANSGHVAHQWFQSTQPRLRERGVAFTAVSVITSDPPSVESVLRWASELQRRVEYLIVKNALTYPPDFSHWEQNPKAEQFRRFFRPQEIEVEYRVEQFESLLRRFGALPQIPCSFKENAPASAADPRRARKGERCSAGVQIWPDRTFAVLRV